MSSKRRTVFALGLFCTAAALFAGLFKFSSQVNNDPVKTLPKSLGNEVVVQSGASETVTPDPVTVRSEAAFNVPLVTIAGAQKTAKSVGSNIIPTISTGTLPGDISLGSLWPPLELQRENEEAKLSPTQSGKISVSSGFECATRADATVLSPTHIKVALETQGHEFCDWFLFKINGVKGKTVRIDLTAGPGVLKRWSTLNPVFSYETALSNISPDSFSTTPKDQQKDEFASNGIRVIDVDNGPWRYLKNTWMESPDVLSIVQTFESDAALIGMRFPRSPAHNGAYLNRIERSGICTVTTIGRSALGRPLKGVVIGTPRDKAGNPNPCVLLYAGEHPDEHDTGWVVEGAIDFLLGPSDIAANIREKMAFVLIPTLDPDSCALSIHEGIIGTFQMGRRSPESKAYANWFRSWLLAGHRLDVVLNLHSLQSNEGPQIYCALLEGGGRDRGEAAFALHTDVIDQLDSQGYITSKRPAARGISPQRLGGWLTQTFGAVTLAYEVNSQSAIRHLNVAGLKDLGKDLVTSTGNHLLSPNGQDILRLAVSGRAKWEKAYREVKNAAVAGDAIHEASLIRISDLNYGDQLTGTSGTLLP